MNDLFRNLRGRWPSSRRTNGRRHVVFATAPAPGAATNGPNRLTLTAAGSDCNEPAWLAYNSDAYRNPPEYTADLKPMRDPALPPETRDHNGQVES